MEGLDLYNEITETKAVEVKHQLVTANDWYEELFRTKTAKKKISVFAYFALFIVTSFISRSWLKVTVEVLFISIFYWCSNDTPRSGCLDVV